MASEAVKAITGGVISMIFGAALLSATLLVMNRKVHRVDRARRDIIADLSVAKKKAPPVNKRVTRPKPKPRRARPRAAPRPMLASNLAGLGVGLPMFQLGDMGQLGKDLLDDQAFTEDMVLTEDAVDRLPEPRSGNAQPSYPPRARAAGIEGQVILRFVIDAQGGVRSVTVLKAEPAGVFEESVLTAARTWSFEPAMYKGRPVQMSFEMPLAFRLN